VEAGMFPCREHGNHFSGNLPFGEKHLENIVSEACPRPGDCVAIANNITPYPPLADTLIT
jgi:hypothetical protein